MSIKWFDNFKMDNTAEVIPADKWKILDEVSMNGNSTYDKNGLSVNGLDMSYSGTNIGSTYAVKHLPRAEDNRLIVGMNLSEYVAQLSTTKLPNPAQLPTNSANGVAYSPDGNYMSVAHVSAPFITNYKREGDVFTKLPNPAQLPTGAAYGVAYSPDGNYMSVGQFIAPFITNYKREGDVFTKLPNPAQLPTNNAYGVAYSPLLGRITYKYSK